MKWSCHFHMLLKPYAEKEFESFLDISKCGGYCPRVYLIKQNSIWGNLLWSTFHASLWIQGNILPNNIRSNHIVYSFEFLQRIFKWLFYETTAFPVNVSQIPQRRDFLSCYTSSGSSVGLTAHPFTTSFPNKSMILKGLKCPYVSATLCLSFCTREFFSVCQVEISW